MRHTAIYYYNLNYVLISSLVDRESCAKSFDGFSKLPRGLDENMLCVLDTNVTRRADACHGDSGGPLLMLTGSNHSIVGITAFGQSCGGSIPGVYTAVYSYLEWIEKEVWSDMINEWQMNHFLFGLRRFSRSVIQHDRCEFKYFKAFCGVITISSLKLFVYSVCAAFIFSIPTLQYALTNFILLYVWFCC